MKTMNIGILMIAALVAAVLSACSSNNLVEDFKVDEYAIGFTPETQKTTKAGITPSEGDTDGKLALANAGGFYVWGWKTPKYDEFDESGTFIRTNWNWASTANGLYQVFDKQKVTGVKNTAGTAVEKWTYSPTKYWDRKCKYCFYAAAPAEKAAAEIKLVSVAGSTKVDDRIFEIKEVPSLSSADAAINDFVIDRNIHSESDGNKDYLNPVSFTFHHIMSKVVIKFKAGVDNCTFKVTEVKLSGYDNHKYDFVQTHKDNGTAANRAEWTIQSGASANKAGEAKFGLTSEFGNNVASNTSLPTEAEASNYWIMAPHKPGTITFTVSYTITYSDGKTDTFKNVTAQLMDQEWFTDCLTTYTLTISPKPIKFDVTSVSWTKYESQGVVIKQ